MVRDRLTELQGLQEEDNSKMKKTDKNGKAGNSDDLSTSLAWVTQIDEKLAKLRQDVDDMQKLQKNLFFTPVYDKKEVMKLDKLSDKIFSTATGIQNEIKNYRTEFTKKDTSDTEERMIKNHIDRLLHAVTNLMNDHRAAQADYIEKTKKRYNRQIEIVTGEEVNENNTTVDPKNVHAVFAGNFMEEMQQARLELREVEARDVEIKKLEGGVLEVNQLFKELNALVMEQGEVITTIEQNVEAASANVEVGNVQLRQARRKKKKWFKKKCCLIGVCVAVILIAAGIIILVVLTG